VASLIGDVVAGAALLTPLATTPFFGFFTSRFPLFLFFANAFIYLLF